MEKIIVEKSKAKLLKLILVGAAFVAVGVGLLSGESLQSFKGMLYGVITASFAIATLFYLKELLTNKPLIVMDENGIELQHYGKIPWSDIKDISDFGQLLFIFVENEKTYVDRLPFLLRLFAQANKAFGSSAVYVPSAYCQGDQKSKLIDALVKKLRFENKSV